ncbi:hypothetical protein FACS1894141_6170 [Spirochaetia bacterium]|nr:hypothetical protein FACS1894141_6170 [Spirochaetia bacterium]
MEITFESSSPSKVSYPNPPSEYIFKPGIVTYKPVKKRHGINGSAIAFIIFFGVYAVAFVAYSYRDRLSTLLTWFTPSVTPVSEPEIPILPTATVINALLNIRSGPSTKNSVVIQAHKDDILTVTGTEENGWLPVEYNGTAGFVSAELVKINE